MNISIFTRFEAVLIFTVMMSSAFAQVVIGSVKTLLGTAYVQRGSERVQVTKEMSL